MRLLVIYQSTQEIFTFWVKNPSYGSGEVFREEKASFLSKKYRPLTLTIISIINSSLHH